MIGRVVSLLLIAWLLGFAAFMLTLGRPVDGVVTDAIVVPTGAAGRIDRGLDLLRAHRAQRMFVSGVAPEVRPIELATRYRARALFACCVDLGSEAVDTRSNADEITAWVRRHHYRSIRLVTSDWHLARARLELGSALGHDIRIVGEGGPGAPPLSLLVGEYNKLILRWLARAVGYRG